MLWDLEFSSVQFHRASVKQPLQCSCYVVVGCLVFSQPKRKGQYFHLTWNAQPLDNVWWLVTRTTRRALGLAYLWRLSSVGTPVRYICQSTSIFKIRFTRVWRMSSVQTHVRYICQSTSSSKYILLVCEECQVLKLMFNICQSTSIWKIRITRVWRLSSVQTPVSTYILCQSTSIWKIRITRVWRLSSVQMYMSVYFNLQNTYYPCWRLSRVQPLFKCIMSVYFNLQNTYYSCVKNVKCSNSCSNGYMSVCSYQQIYVLVMCYNWHTHIDSFQLCSQ